MIKVLLLIFGTILFIMIFVYIIGIWAAQINEEDRREKEMKSITKNKIEYANKK